MTGRIFTLFLNYSKKTTLFTSKSARMQAFSFRRVSWGGGVSDGFFPLSWRTNFCIEYKRFNPYFVKLGKLWRLYFVFIADLLIITTVTPIFWRGHPFFYTFQYTYTILLVPNILYRYDIYGILCFWVVKLRYKKHFWPKFKPSIIPFLVRSNVSIRTQGLDLTTRSA